MDILNTVSLESNSQIKINFDGGGLSSDAGLLLFKEFLFKIGAVRLINRMFKTNDTAWLRIHKDDANMMQVIYQIISVYSLKFLSVPAPAAKLEFQTFYNHSNFS